MGSCIIEKQKNASYSSNCMWHVSVFHKNKNLSPSYKLFLPNCWYIHPTMWAIMSLSHTWVYHLIYAIVQQLSLGFIRTKVSYLQLQFDSTTYLLGDHNHSTLSKWMGMCRGTFLTMVLHTYYIFICFEHSTCTWLCSYNQIERVHNQLPREACSLCGNP